MIIVYCIEGLHNPGGMERVLTTKANFLAQHFHYNIHLAIKTAKCEPFFTLDDSITCHYLNTNDKRTYIKKLSELLYTIRPDISISMCGSEFSFLYKIKDGSKKIAEFHFTKYYLSYLVNGIERLKYRSLHRLKAFFIQKMEERYVKHYEKVVLLTKQDLEIWGYPPNMTYIHNPLSFRSDRVSAQTQKTIIATGRFIAQKGFLLLIESFRIIAKEFLDWKLIIYGEGQEQDIIESRIKEYDLDSQVYIHKPTANIQEAFLNSSFFVFPSIYEGFGLVLTEAMECGLPCIAFDCECGPREIIQNNKNGFLVKNKDTKTFAEKMRVLMENDTLRKTMGEYAKKSVSAFYTDTILEKWNLLLKTL